MNYCVITQTQASTPGLLSTFIEGAVQPALDRGCTLQGGISISEWSKSSYSGYFALYAQAMLCSVPCSQVNSIKTFTDSNTGVLTNNEIESIVQLSGDMNAD